jgi:ribosomal-protein-alanine N-acetyltransferase
MADDLKAGSPRVRRFEPRDAERVREIAEQTAEAAQWSAESFQHLGSDAQFAWVVDSAVNGVIGFLVARTVAADEAEILNLAVAPANRRSGYATQLLQACLNELARRNIQNVYLEVRESNLTATGFYEKHKFVRTGRRPAYYQHPTEAAVLLVRKLTA